MERFGWNSEDKDGIHFNITLLKDPTPKKPEYVSGMQLSISAKESQEGFAERQNIMKQIASSIAAAAQDAGDRVLERPHILNDIEIMDMTMGSYSSANADVARGDMQKVRQTLINMKEVPEGIRFPDAVIDRALEELRQVQLANKSEIAAGKR